MPAPSPETMAMWKTHIEEAKRFSGTERDYCFEHNLSPQKFEFYKRRILGKRKSKGFTAVQVRRGAGLRKDFDPKWLAEFLREFLR